ncbi:MAG: hypothetical protein HZB51_30055 [Chloroflexi bacterium]|nr:hypothetical protein [Chloroflexota bacterium]
MLQLRFVRASLGLIVIALLFVFSPVASAQPLDQAFNFLSGCTGEYFNNVTVSGSPAYVRGDGALNFFWPENASPAPGINVNNYSVRWTCSVYVATAGNYSFTILTDDGMNVVLDGNPVIWAFYDQGPTSYSATTSVNAGWHTVKVEYYNRWMAGTAQVLTNMVSGPGPVPTATPISPVPTNVWHGQYFNNISLSGSPTLVRDDAVLNFNWGNGSPDPSIPIDFFSVKWDSTQYLAYTGNYQISATSDDGVRVWVDGALVIDAWYDHSATTFVATRYLTAGAHAFHVEYYDHTLTALINVQITYGAVPVPTTPVPQPRTMAAVDDLGFGWQAGGAGGWVDSPIGVNNHSYWMLNRTYSSSGYSWARWYPTLTAPGYYEVFAFIPANQGSTLNARYWIYHGGRYSLASRAQGFYYHQWVSLGTYYFSATGGEYVSLANVTYECYACRTVTFDAIKFEPR